MKDRMPISACAAAGLGARYVSFLKAELGNDFLAAHGNPSRRKIASAR
jgi:hypothetical protein